jgi:hypothetical protein
MLAAGEAPDVIWSSSNPDREKRFRPIKISLLKNLNEYRILLIRKEDQHLFTNIQTLDDLKTLSAGSGAHWSDTNILKRNHLPTIVAPTHDSLFRMLSSNRFDYMSRGLYELVDTTNYLKVLDLEDGLVFEKHLLLHYRVPFYYFVHKDNKSLAERLQKGLEITLKDGSFDEAFFKYEDYKNGYQILDNHDRRIIRLQSEFELAH